MKVCRCTPSFLYFKKKVIRATWLLFCDILQLHTSGICCFLILCSQPILFVSEWKPLDFVAIRQLRLCFICIFYLFLLLMFLHFSIDCFHYHRLHLLVDSIIFLPFYFYFSLSKVYFLILPSFYFWSYFLIFVFATHSIHPSFSFAFLFDHLRRFFQFYHFWYLPLTIIFYIDFDSILLILVHHKKLNNSEKNITLVRANYFIVFLSLYKDISSHLFHYLFWDYLSFWPLWENTSIIWTFNYSFYNY